MTSASKFAADFRALLGLRQEQVVGDLEEIIRIAGYRYLEHPLEDSCSGFSAWVGNHNYLICYNSDHQNGSAFKRFTLAHELGHIQMHFKILHGEEPLINSQGLQSKDPREVEANKFAAHFLMPQDAFSPMAESLPFNAEGIRKLAEHFNVSELATALHYIELTDRACTMVVCDSEGNTKWESRSKNMTALIKRASYVYGRKVPNRSLTADLLRKPNSNHTARMLLSEWMPDVKVDIEVEESVVKTPNNLYLALLTPTFSDSETEEY